MRPELSAIPGERVEVIHARRRLSDLAFTADQLAGSPAPHRPWHVKDMIPVRAVTLLQGDGGTGKSVLALQLCVSTVLGRPWLGQNVLKGNAIYLSAEDDRDEIHRRLEAIATDYGVDLSDLSGLKVLDVTGQDAVIATGDRQGLLTTTERWDELRAEIAAWGPALVVLDNLADVFAGDENSRPQARQFISHLQGCIAAQDASMVLIGHPSLAGIASGTGASGSTAWNNSVRSRMYLTRPAGEDGGAPAPDIRLLTVKKANYGPSGIELRLRWFAGAFTADGAASAPISALDMAAAQARVDRAFLSMLETYTARQRRVSDSPSANWAPKVFASDPAGEGITRAAFRDAMNRLFSAGEITIEHVGPPSRMVKRIVRTAPNV